MVGSEPFSSSTPLCFLFLVFCFVLDHGGEAIRWVSGAYPASDTVVVDWIKLASFVTMKGDTSGYTRLVWLWCLGLAWLELQVFEKNSRARSSHRYRFNFLGRRFRIKGGWILRVITEPNDYLSWEDIWDLTLVTKEDRSTVQGVAWVREEPQCYVSHRLKIAR